MTVREAMAELGVSRARVHQLIKQFGFKPRLVHPYGGEYGKPAFALTREHINAMKRRPKGTTMRQGQNNVEYRRQGQPEHGGGRLEPTRR